MGLYHSYCLVIPHCSLSVVAIFPHCPHSAEGTVWGVGGPSSSPGPLAGCVPQWYWFDQGESDPVSCGSGRREPLTEEGDGGHGPPISVGTEVALTTSCSLCSSPGFQTAQQQHTLWFSLPPAEGTWASCPSQQHGQSKDSLNYSGCNGKSACLHHNHEGLGSSPQLSSWVTGWTHERLFVYTWQNHR